MSNTKIIILDFDGTLGDTTKVIIRTMHATIKEMGLPERTDAECATMIGPRLIEIPPMLFPGMDVDCEQYAETYRRNFKIYNTDGAVEVYPNVLETLKALKDRGYILTIASSRSNSTLISYVNKLGLADTISHTIGAEDVKAGKPDPEAVVKTLEKFGLKPDEAIVVGDTMYDVQMGVNAGTRTCAVTYGNGKRETLSEATWVIDDFGHLLDLEF
jgi:phosphoglycolate phosphatase